MDKLEETVIIQGGQISGLLAAVSELTDTMQKMHKTVYGNGEPGMDENVRNTVKDLQNATAERHEMQSDIKDIKKTVDALAGNKTEKIEKMKLSAETKQTILHGLFTLAGIVLAVLVAK